MQHKTYWSGFWRLADPKISLASFAGMFMAACFAASDDELHFSWLALTVLGVFFVEIAKNALGEIVDFDSGTDLAVAAEDRSPFSGGKRVLVDRLLTREQTRHLAFTFFSAAIAIGLGIALLRDPRVLGFGVAGMALAWLYHGPPLRLAYRGLGEPAVAIAYGPIVVCGTYLVQTTDFNAALIHASISLGLLIAAFLWINEFPDYHADKAAGKNNLVVRFGRDPAVFAYFALLATAYLWVVLCAVYYDLQGMYWGTIGAPAALFSAWRLSTSGGVTGEIIAAQAACLLSFILMACGTGIGYWFFG